MGGIGLLNIAVALVFIAIFSLLAGRADRRAWCKHAKNAAWRESQRKMALWKAHRAGVKADLQFLKQLFAREVTNGLAQTPYRTSSLQRDHSSGEAQGDQRGQIRCQNRHFKVPEGCIGWHVWVANFFGQYIEASP